MTWLTHLMPKKLARSWTYSTRGQIWRLLPSASRCLLLEDREVDSKKVSFACIDAITGAARWRDLSFDERWWISMEAVHDDVVFIHEYAAPDMPDHKKIVAVDIGSGRVLWSNGELKYMFAHQDAVYAAKDEYDRRRFFELGLHDGKVLREIEDSYVSVLRSTVVHDRFADVHFPQPLAGGGQTAGPAPEIINRIVPQIESAEMAEYLEHDLLLVVGYYERMQVSSARPLYRQHLSIARKDSRRILFEDVLTREALTCVPDMFFRMADHLYYIKERNSVSAVNLART